VRCEFTSPFGSPRAYFLRGTLVALRREQAERILVRPAAPAPA
jgi:Fe2+ transport system protein FeoA